VADPEREPEEEILPQDARKRLEEVGGAEILVGIPAINSAATIGHVITAVEAGLRKHFPNLDAVICVSDGGSEDGTLDAAEKAGVGDDAVALLVPPATPAPRKIGFRYLGTSGKGTAFRAILEAASLLGVRACAVVDSDLRSITPSWLDRLLGPVVHHGFEYVAPVYARHKYDGTITNSIAYPLTTALYGVRIRQPIGGEFGFSGELARAFAAEHAWHTDVARFGIDIWMTTVALVRGARTCQAALGAKIHDPRDPGKHLGPMFRQVVGSLYALAGRYRDRWWDVEDVTRPPTFGFRAVYAAEPIEVAVRRLTWKFVDGYVRHQALWRQVLSEESMAEVEETVTRAAEETGGLVLEPELWFRIVYDYLVAYNLREVDAGHLLDSLIPLYFARTATFVEASSDDTDEEAEARVEEGVDLAVRLKPYLKERWSRLEVPARELEEQPVPKLEGEEAADALTARNA
jgi:glycosyltransferase involved in cell wall biosynthesis